MRMIDNYFQGQGLWIGDINGSFNMICDCGF